MGKHGHLQEHRTVICTMFLFLAAYSIPKLNLNDSLVGSSKEEVFFDSQPWLESDCEDFFTISADSTLPYHGNIYSNEPKQFQRNSLT
ncbi:unnamed protein product, partial [Vitis vinifera]|uniref:Uncharacterized protein n=1 Tax=Vitis vinifera TaxID=29760 RepID=D7TAT1_VITVI